MIIFNNKTTASHSIPRHKIRNVSSEIKKRNQTNANSKKSDKYQILTKSLFVKGSTQEIKEIKQMSIYAQR